VTCFAIGIGGTGSKCLEALLHTCAAGLGPEAISIAIVDQDRSNGNVAQLRQVLDTYRQLRRSLRGNGSELVTSAPFRTAIRTLDDPVWSPLPQQRVTLEAHFNYRTLRKEARLLFDALFEQERERAQPLDEGFRGRPAVGAAAMYSESAQEEGFWTELFQELRDSASGEIRICIFASIFGGTGAAGFPTISRVIKNAATRHRGRVSIGGVLLLPYFTFPDDRPNENLARAKDFLHTTQQALLYYHDLLTKSHRGLFDHLYLIGSEKPFTLPNLGAGSNQQVNPSLLPELLAALGALHFFREVPRGPSKQDRSVILRGGHHPMEAPATPAITWDDIPRVGADGNIHDVRENLGRLARFAMSYLSFYRPCLGPVIPRGIAGQPWFHNLITRRSINLRDDRVQDTLAALDRYCNRFLNWCFDLSRRSDPGDLPVRLFEFDGNANGAAHSTSAAPVSNGSRAAFDRLVAVSQPRNLPDVFASLSSERPPADGRGLGIFVDQLFAACRLQ